MKIGDSIILEPKNSLQPEKYKSKILEINDQAVYIDYPVNIATKRTIFLTDGTQLKVTYISVDGSVYIFDSEVLGKVKSTISMIHLQNPNKQHHVKIQRREYVRIETKVDTAIHSKNGSFKPFTTMTDDISAGGAAVLVPKDFLLETDTLLTMWLVLPLKSGEINYARIDCQVVRIIDREESTRNILTLKFINISNGERQLLIRFCFEKQLELRNKGLE